MTMRFMNRTLGKTALDNSAHFTDEKTEAQSEGSYVPGVALWSEVAQLVFEFPLIEPAWAEVLMPLEAVLEGLMELPDPGMARRGLGPSWTHLENPLRGQEPTGISWCRREKRGEEGHLTGWA